MKDETCYREVTARHRNLINYLADKSRYLLEISSASHSTGMNEESCNLEEENPLKEKSLSSARQIPISELQETE